MMRPTLTISAIGVLTLSAAGPLLSADHAGHSPAAFQVPQTWEYTAPLIAPEKRDQDPSRAQKDPTVVHHAGKWHVFMTVKLPDKSAIEYCSFAGWKDADASPRTILRVSDSKYYCAPQVFTSGRTRNVTSCTR